MLNSMCLGCHEQGEFHGVLKVKRRAFELNAGILAEISITNSQEWVQLIRKKDLRFRDALKWVSAIALEVNEVNAAELALETEWIVKTYEKSDNKTKKPEPQAFT